MGAFGKWNRKLQRDMVILREKVAWTFSYFCTVWALWVDSRHTLEVRNSTLLWRDLIHISPGVICFLPGWESSLLRMALCPKAKISLSLEERRGRHAMALRKLLSLSIQEFLSSCGTSVLGKSGVEQWWEAQDALWVNGVCFDQKSPVSTHKNVYEYICVCIYVWVYIDNMHHIYLTKKYIHILPTQHTMSG